MTALRRHRHLLLFCLVLAVGLVLRVWGLTWGLHNADVSRRPHPDEWVVYWVFHWFDRNHNPNVCPQPGALPHRQCFYDWGGLYLYLAYAVKLIVAPVIAILPGKPFGPHADPDFIRAVLAGRVMSVLASTATIGVVYRAGIVMRGKDLGLLAAAVMAISGLLAQLAHFATPDSTTILVMSLALLGALYCAASPTRLRFALTGAAAGLAAGSEYHMALLAIPIVGAWLLTRQRDSRLLLVAVGAAVAAWALADPYAILQPGAFLDAGLHSLRVRTVDSGTQYQGRWAQYGPALLYVVRYPLGYGVGFLLTAWLVLGAAWGLLRRDRSTLVLLLWIVPYFVLVTVSPAKFMRYSAPLLPPLALLGARFFLDLAPLARPRLRPGLGAIAAATAVYTLVYDGAYASLFSAPDARQVAAAWLKTHATPHAPVGFEEIPDGLLNLPYFVTDAGFLPCFSTFQAAHLQGPARYYVVDDYALEEHPDVASVAVDRFRSSLEHSTQYRRVFHVEYVPSWLGVAFPITGSPHDWRYPAHSITVYQHLRKGIPGLGQCYPSLGAAQEALYVPPPDSSG
jgi:dolichyl-phosphate-mannose-protein mannosyltransferase